MIRCLIPVCAGALTALTLAFASPADAHQNCTKNGAADRDYACVSANHGSIYACDHESDGHRVWAQFRDAQPSSIPINTAMDPDGAGGSCGVGYLPNPANFYFRLCEENYYGAFTRSATCSAWDRF